MIFRRHYRALNVFAFIFATVLLFGSLPSATVYAFDGHEQNSSTLRLTPFSTWAASQTAGDRISWQNVSASILSLVSDSGTCSATRISPDGLFLTARHCLQRCLIRSGLFKSVVEQGAVTYFELNRDQLGRAQCEVALGNESDTVTIMSAGPGLVMPMDEASFRVVNPVLFEALIERGYTASGDFVVFKAQTPRLKNGPFLKFASSGVAPGEIVSSIGFPNATNRPDGFNSDGKTRYLTRGTVSRGIEYNHCLEGPEYENYDFSRLKRIFNDPHSFLSSLDVVYGSSGSVVVNSRGEIVGILTNVFRLTSITKKSEDEPENRFCSGSAKALRIERIQKLMADSALLSQLEPN